MGAVYNEQTELFRCLWAQITYKVKSKLRLAKQLNHVWLAAEISGSVTTYYKIHRAATLIAFMPCFTLSVTCICQALL